jgi:ribonuclease D
LPQGLARGRGRGDGMEIRYVDDAAGADEVRSAMEGEPHLALDCEAAGYHRYSDRLCLLQLTVDDRTFLVDPFAVDPAPVLQPTLEDPGTEIVMHGADFDVRLLNRDLGIGLAGLFDTQVAASLLGESAIGLAALLQSRLGIHLSKKYQKADWAQRPLPGPMREYAALDTAHLRRLADSLRADLDERGRLEWAREEFRELEKVRFDASGPEDPVLRVRAARDLEPREVARLREALEWRDGIARSRDRATFRVVGDPVLIEVARRGPTSIPELEGIQGLNGSLARQEGPELLRRLARVDALPDADVPGYPRFPRNGSMGRGRPLPEVEERFGRLREVRNAAAVELGIDRGAVLPNAVLQLLAETPPSNGDELESVEGMRRWQAELLGDALMQVL